MPLIRFQPLASARRIAGRTAAPSCRSGASSLLRVGHPAMTFVPRARALAQRLATSAARAPETA